FIESIPNALKNLDSLLKIGVADEYPVLKKVCEQICSDGRFEPDSHSGLLITVFSFSYKKGYPADYTGNGGGFMFDCRGMHNPGRYEEYKPLTGRDKPVVDFLEERGEVQKFCATAVDLVSPSVECYIRRGFSNLQIGFGCTGGRHRSVYCAERVSRALSEKFPDAAVRLIHREQGLIKDL
ncbi:MAG: phosphotransferase, partial [Muribaculaceae bacterium]|nr:phosphotransferase [Muribaculaceae bacterium]